MERITQDPSATEGEYLAFQEAWKRYLKSERPIDSVLKRPDFQREGLRICASIVRGADVYGDIFAAVCAQFLRYDTEGPPANPQACRPKSLRTAGLDTPEQFWAYFNRSARNMDNSRWRKENGREGKPKGKPEGKPEKKPRAPVYNFTAEELACVPAAGVSPEDRTRLVEIIDAVGSLGKKYLHTYFYWLAGYTTRETAAAMGCSHVTAQNRLKVAQAKALGIEAPPLRKAS